MDRSLIIFICIVVILFIGHLIYNETFIDSSGNTDASGNLNDKLFSISDFLAIVGSSCNNSKSTNTINGLNPWTQPPRFSNHELREREREREMRKMQEMQENARMYNPISNQYSNLMNSNPSWDNDVKDSSQNCGNPINMSSNGSPSISQGNSFIKYTQQMNPADYIRKDSIPCYACTLP